MVRLTLLGVGALALLACVPASVASDGGAFVPSVKTIMVRQAQDEVKGAAHGILGQQLFRMAPGTSGISDQLRFEFSAPAEIVSVDVSTDVSDRRAALVELAVGINNTQGYGFSRSADWLMHVSWAGGDKNPRHFDETVQLPPGVEVAARDFVGVGAWIGATGDGELVSVSPDIVVLYRWLE